MKDYLKKYATNVVRFQQGGAMPPQGGGQGPDIEGMLQQYAQQPDPELAMAICDTLIAMMSQGAPQGAPQGPPQEGQPMPAASRGMRMKGAPIFKAGGKL